MVDTPLTSTTERILIPPTPSDLRAELEAMVLADLLGPAGGPQEEVNERSVRDRYLVGMLAPRGQQILPEEQDDLGDEEPSGVDEGPADSGAPSSATMFPSSFGLSFCVDGKATVLSVSAKWGQYKREQSETLVSPKKGDPKTVWQRYPRGGALVIPLKEGTLEPLPPDNEQLRVVIQGRVRRREDSWIVTLFLVNTQEEPERLRDEAWIFQPELSVSTPENAAVFKRRATNRNTQRGDEFTRMEAEMLSMIYRKRVEFAVGHGVSVVAEASSAEPTCAVRLTTGAVGRYEVGQTTAPGISEIPGLTVEMFDMKTLSEMDGETLVRTLDPLARAYASWLKYQKGRAEDPTTGLSEYSAAARKALEDGEVALARMRMGIILLGSDTRAARAFAFMNRAMWEQRIHALMAQQVRRGEKADRAVVDIPEERSWRPFQLAFILLNVPGLTDLNHPERAQGLQAVADLLWFPTGGGKTEAYLGLTAYTLAIRRLQGVIAGRSGENGVAVLMRYTLRLLTLQQFQRAASLICACEMIRREAITRGDTSFGKVPFRLGLWVGQRTTPNTTEQSAEAVKQDHGQFNRGSAAGGSGSPAQITSCPWCGSKIEATKHIRVDAKIYQRTFIYCGDPDGKCLFSEKLSPYEGLPLLVVDEEIYRLLPALVIATVDKFAQMPWNGKIQLLFGQVDRYCPRHGFLSPEMDKHERHRSEGNLPATHAEPHNPLRPPDLIIQDELHLISGPLGSLVGLYESVVDRLCSWEVNGQRVRPKVVASTATIRRAPDQVQALFMRQVKVFPPQGLDVDDNFFSRQRNPTTRTPGRLYLGICAPGRRMKAALIRVYVAFLAAGQTLYNKYGAAADPWMTLTGYFNSMNELGGMRRLVDDDVRARLGRVDARGLSRRFAPRLEELTSRKSAGDIPRVLGLLETPFDPAAEARRAARKKAGQPPEGDLPLDVLLATNMISVGVDVSRLGLMVVAGQPKTTAEYIQATSRVGRNTPGIVCTVYNWARPRDLSHYESFDHYHATFYQHVEALSVTPFASRALDRGLSALLISYIRLLSREFNANNRAGQIPDRNHPLFKEALLELSNRAALVTARQEVGQQVQSELSNRIDEWMYQAHRQAGGSILGYRKERGQGTLRNLLTQPELGGWPLFTCLNSLREVEPSINLILDEREFADPILQVSAGPGVILPPEENKTVAEEEEDY